MPASLESYRPGPDRLWVRYRPRNWPTPAEGWTDLARGAPGHGGRSDSALPDGPPPTLDDTVYLPPVHPRDEPRRRELARAWAGQGTPVLLQLAPGDEPESTAGVVVVWDLSTALLSHDLGRLGTLPRGAAAVWPLVAVLTDAPDLLAAGLDRLAERGVEVVQPLVLELSAAVKRRLLEGRDEEVFDRLFHGPPASDRDVARRVLDRGFRPFLARPLPAGNPRLAARRRCAGELRLAAYLSHRLARPGPESQSFLRAARWIDREDHDLVALVEEGNLEIVDWIDERSRSVVVEVVRGAASPTVEALLDEFATSEPAGL